MIAIALKSHMVIQHERGKEIMGMMIINNNNEKVTRGQQSDTVSIPFSLKYQINVKPPLLKINR